MSRHLAQILQMVDLSHPAYFSFHNLQSSHQIADDLLVPSQPADFYQQAYYTSQLEAETTDMSLVSGLEPLSYEATATRRTYSHRSKPRSWIPARPVAHEPTRFAFDEQDL